MNNYQSVDHSGILPCDTLLSPAAITGEFKCLNAMACDWGQLTIDEMPLPEVAWVKFEGQVKQNLHLKKRDERNLEHT